MEELKAESGIMHEGNDNGIEQSGIVHEEKDEATSVIPMEASNNFIMRKPFRSRRYFEQPNSIWRTCYKFGDEDHTCGNRTAANLRKPCYKCGRTNHNPKRCTKRKDCLICKKGGHRAKDCPEKHPGPQDPKTCLKCGDAGHHMMSCRSVYSVDDLKDIQCYICRNLGHLCCVEYTDNGPAEVSCYRCGQLGHSGSACFETRGGGSCTACYKCGEEGHFAYKCPCLTEVGERNTESVDPGKSFSKENKHEMISLPNDCDGSITNKDFDDAESKLVSDHMGCDTLGSNSKHKAVWTTNDHVTSNGSEYKANV